MSFLVDTDICSAYMKGNHHVWQHFMQYRGQLHVSAVTAGELFTWALRARASPKRLPTLLDLLNDLTVLVERTAGVGAQRPPLRNMGPSLPGYCGGHGVLECPSASVSLGTASLSSVAPAGIAVVPKAA